MTTVTNAVKANSSAVAVKATDWNEELTLAAVEAYEEILKVSGKAVANSTASLESIAQKVNINKTAQGVRQKLSNAGVYQKNDTIKKVGGASPLRKAHYIKALESALEVEADTFLSMENVKLDALKTLVDKLQEVAPECEVAEKLTASVKTV